MNHSPYRKYQPSGIDWLAAVPAHWEIKRLKYFADRADEKIEADGENPLPYVALEHIESWTGHLLPLDSELAPTGLSNRFRPGDTLFGKLRPYLAKACNVDFDGICSTELLVLRPDKQDRRFLLYVLLSEGFISLVDASTFGAKMPRADWGFIGLCRMPQPTVQEQRAIADFLDRKTKVIGTLITKNQALIAKLKEKRTTLLSSTLTRGLPADAARAVGLNPQPKLKPSGVAWLGKIPEHWKLKRLKYSATINDEALPETTDPEFEITYVDISSVDEVLGIVAPEGMAFGDAPSRARRIVRDGDTIISTVRTYLRVITPICLPGPNTIVSTGFAVIRPREADARFLSYALREPGFVDEIVARSVGVTYPGINPSEIGMLPVPLPPEPEQRAIADFLDAEIEKLDQMTKKVETAITRLAEYRKALITAAVTGKIDVREVA